MTTAEEPRIPPLRAEDAPPEALPILRDWPYNLHKTLAHNIPTLTRWMPYVEHILRNNTLPEREREIAILRVAWNSRSAYEWGMHAGLARSLGFTDADLENIARGTERSGSTTDHWSATEAAIIDAVDDIMTDWKVGAAAWAALEAEFDEKQLIDLLFVTAQFIHVAVTLNSVQIELEPGLEPLPTL